MRRALGQRVLCQEGYPVSRGGHQVEREDIQRRRAEALEQKLLDIVADPLPVPGWYEHPAVWFAAGVVLTGAAGVAALHYLDD